MIRSDERHRATRRAPPIPRHAEAVTSSAPDAIAGGAGPPIGDRRPKARRRTSVVGRTPEAIPPLRRGLVGQTSAVIVSPVQRGSRAGSPSPGDRARRVAATAAVGVDRPHPLVIAGPGARRSPSLATSPTARDRHQVLQVPGEAPSPHQVMRPTRVQLGNSAPLAASGLRVSSASWAGSDRLPMAPPPRSPARVVSLAPDRVKAVLPASDLRSVVPMPPLGGPGRRVPPQPIRAARAGSTQVGRVRPTRPRPARVGAAATAAAMPCPSRPPRSHRLASSASFRLAGWAKSART